jgi:nucleoside-diphosphate-sugar epimerase
VSEPPTNDPQRAASARPRERAEQPLCLITGASGFIGGALAARLTREGYATRCLVRVGSDTSRLSRLDVQIVLGDLTDPSSLAEAVQGADHVLHCAALVSDWATKGEIRETNVLGTRSLLGAAAAASVERFVHLSTTDVYGYPNRPAVDESYSSTRFRNWYSQSKREAEAEVRRAEAEHGLRCVILRPATVYGPGSTEVVGEIARAIRARHMLLIGRGRAVAGLCYVENLVDAALLALGHDSASGEVFNVTDGLQVSWRRFTDDLAAGLDSPRVRFSLPLALAGGLGFALEHGYRLLRAGTGLRIAPLLSRQAVQVLGENQDFSNRKARQTLGWEPRVEYKAGLGATLAWLRSEYLQLD